MLHPQSQRTIAPRGESVQTKIHNAHPKLRQRQTQISAMLSNNMHAPDKASSKDNKLRDFSRIAESHKSPSLASSSERTADFSINVTTEKRPMKRCNRSTMAEWDKEGKHGAAASSGRGAL